MKPGAVIVLNEQHPCTNMLASEGDAEFDPDHRTECHFSYFEHEWTGNGGMYYMTKKSYHSKTFTDFTHSMSDIISFAFAFAIYIYRHVERLLMRDSNLKNLDVISVFE